MKKFLSNNPFNCWDLLKIQHYNVIGNDKRDSLKSLNIGRSAAKTLSLFDKGKVRRLNVHSSEWKQGKSHEIMI